MFDALRPSVATSSCCWSRRPGPSLKRCEQVPETTLLACRLHCLSELHTQLLAQTCVPWREQRQTIGKGWEEARRQMTECQEEPRSQSPFTGDFLASMRSKKVQMRALKWGLRVLVLHCLQSPTTVIILRRKFPSQKGPKGHKSAQLQTIVRALPSGLKPKIGFSQEVKVCCEVFFAEKLAINLKKRGRGVCASK